jgi:hypothetical protein
MSASNPPTQKARVVVVEDRQSLQAFRPLPERVAPLFNRGLLAFTKRNDLRTAWLSLVQTQDVIGIKVFSAPGTISGTRPALVQAVVQGLQQAGFGPRQIVLWDRHEADLKYAGYYRLAQELGIQIEAADTVGYEDEAFYDKPFIGNLVYGDHEFGKKGDKIGRKSFVTRLLTSRLTKIINLAPLINHNQAGVSGTLYSLALGSVDNTLRFDQSRDRLNEAIPEIWALPQVGDRVVLNVTDALLCQYQGELRGLLHYSTPLGQLWFSRDPVALDLLATEELNRQRQRTGWPLVKPDQELFVNAALLELGVGELRQVVTERLPQP